ncbi:MAG: YggT family protein [Pseudomonadota bacterium]
MIRLIINFYVLVLIVDIILSYFPQVRGQPWAIMVKKVADFTCNPVRKILPPDWSVDISPLIVIIILKFIPPLLSLLW